MSISYAVYSASVRATLEAVDFDADDLPSYAGRMFDYFADNPQAQRLSTWYRLERPDGAGLQAVIEANQARLKALTEAQRRGQITDRFTPVELLTLIQAMAASVGHDESRVRHREPECRPPQSAQRRD